MKLLFVCSGNTCRSPMAEILMRSALEKAQVEGIEVTSAGTDAFPGEPASVNARKAMSERGLDLSSHRARRLDREIIEEADLILTMTSGHRDRVVRLVPRSIEKTFTVKEFAAGAKEDVADPFGQSLDAYKQTADDMARQVDLISRKLARSQSKGRGGPPGGGSDFGDSCRL